MTPQEKIIELEQLNNHLNQTQFADAMHRSPRQIRNWKNGQISMADAEWISAVWAAFQPAAERTQWAKETVARFNG